MDARRNESRKPQGRMICAWAWARTAQQDSIANHWLCSELGMKEARL